MSKRIKKELSQEEKLSLINDFNLKIPTLQLLKKYGIGKDYFNKILIFNNIYQIPLEMIRNHDKTKYKNLHDFSFDEIKDIEDLYLNKNFSAEKIGQMYAVSLYKILNILQSKLGIKTNDEVRKCQGNNFIDKNKELEIVKRYIAGELRKNLIKEFKTSTAKFDRIMRDHNVPIKFPGIKALKNKDIKNIIALYKAGSSMCELKERFNTSEYVISNILKEQNIDTSSYARGIFTRKFLNTKDDYFDVIDTEEKAYFLGLLYADGTNLVDKGSIQISLAEEDKYILEKFGKAVHDSTDLRFIDNEKYKKPGVNMYRLSISSHHMSKILNSHGMVQNKSLILTFPNIIKNSNIEIQKHFIRGVFDGDGCISFENDLASADFNITSTKMFLQEIEKIILNCINLNLSFKMKKAGSGKDNGITKSLCLRGNRQINKVMSWIYEDATIYLTRKYNKYLKIINKIERVDEKTFHFKEKFERDYQKIDPTR